MRILIALLLGGWLLGTLLLAGVASENFYMIDRLILTSPHPSFQKDVSQLPPTEARTMLRYVSSELNRFYFDVWGWIELVLAVVVLALAVATLKERRFILGFGVMLATVAAMVFYIIPEITRVGRALDFIPRDPRPPGMFKFGVLHATYTILDLIKLLVGIWMAVALVRKSEPRQSEPRA